MADRHLPSYLLGAPLSPKVERHITPNLGLHAAGVAAVLGPLRRLCACLLGGIATLTAATSEFAADGAAMPAQQSGDLADGLLGFQEAVNLVSCFSTKMLVH